MGGWIVRRNRRPERLDLLLKRHDGVLKLGAVSAEGVLSASDTLDVSGLYIHSTHAFEPEVNTTPSFRNFPMYVVRTGPEPGSPAVLLVDLREIREVDNTENYPAGPIDPRVGCYTVERGEWSDSRYESDPQGMGLWFPEDLKLHWQYQWRTGSEPYLVATDRSGEMNEKEITWFGWRAIPPDSLFVSFGWWHQGTRFRGAAENEDYVGVLRFQTDISQPVTAPTRLRRTECPGEERT